MNSPTNDHENAPSEDRYPTNKRGLRAVKSFEEQGPVVVWQVNTPLVGGLKKFYLVLDANQKSFGARLEKSRSEDLKTGGAVVAQLRKQLPSGYVPGIYLDPGLGHLWIPFFRDKGPEPAFWIMLARFSPPEVRLVDTQPTILVRKSSQGSYTKKRPLEAPLPQWPLGPDMKDLLPSLLTAFQGKEDETIETVSDAAMSSEIQLPHCSDPTTSHPSLGPDLPEYQKTARDRLSRRTKTLRKSVERLEKELTAKNGLQSVEKRAQLLRDYFHLLAPGESSLTITDERGETTVLDLDPTRSPGANLVEAHESVKKRQRALAKLKEELDRARQALDEANTHLTRLRGEVLALASVQEMMARHHLSLDKMVTSTAKGEKPEALPYKAYVYKSESIKHPVRILVGKGAEGSDLLVKDAKANDFWLHVAGSTGSHVIIPVRDLAGAPPPEELLRRAGILAVFHSKMRESFAGEVYFSRKQHIRKRKGMAPGLWQIDKAETTMIRFDQEELSLVLGMAAP